MARDHDAEAIYTVADQFRDRCLVEGVSLLWPSRKAWSIANLAALHAAFIGHPDLSDKSFFEKWRDQLADQPDDVLRIAADLMALYALFPASRSMGHDAKLRAVNEVISWRPQALALGDDERALLDDAFAVGVGSVGAYYQTGRPWQIQFYLEFAQAVRADGVDPFDWKACRQLADEVRRRMGKQVPARHILLHLLFPDRFEPIASPDHKERIAKAFVSEAGDAADVDDRLFAIHAALAKRFHRTDISFYDHDIRPLWDQPEPPKATRDDGPAAAWLFQANPAIWSLTDALPSIEAGDEDTWSVNRYLGEMQEGDAAFLWQSGPNAGIYAIGELTGSAFERETADFWPDRDERSPMEWAVPFRYTRILDQPILRADLLAHPVLRKLQVIRAPQGRNFRVTPEERSALAELLEDQPPRPEPAPLPRPSLDELAAATFLERADLDELLSLLEEKRQLVLEGPPGSGKTWVAGKLARFLAGAPLAGEADARVELIQLHQSYGYEDFVQGIRPITDERGGLQYRVLPGIFTQLCARARANAAERFVLIIDEINRGNLARIFGELLLLLEYRNERVRLPYGAADGNAEDAYLAIPPNLYLIGTMNSTDRSLALIDYALRRRFYFYRLLPVTNGRAPVLDRWLGQQALNPETRTRLVRLFVALNAHIEERLSPDFHVGHSYFMTPDIGTEAGLERVWRRAILPLLEEYFHDARRRAEVLAQFSPEALLERLEGSMRADVFGDEDA